MTVGADRIYINGDIKTMDDASVAAPTALFTKGGRFVAIGSDAEITALAGPDIPVVDLAGAVVVPGFIETHLHPMMWGMWLSNVNATTGACPTIEEVIAALGERAATTPAGELVQAWGFDDSLVAEDRGLTTADLDRASVQHPIMVRHLSGHGVYVNSVALEMCGIDATAVDPEGGVIVRGADGVPTGELCEVPAMSLVYKLTPAVDPKASSLALLRAQEVMASVGITSFHDMFVTKDMYSTYRELEETGELQLRARLYLGHGVHDQLGEIPEPTDLVNVGGVKLISDGSIQLHTAALTEPYHDLGGCHCGGMAIPAGSLGALVNEHHAAGRQLAIHTNGDQAIDFALDAIAAAQAEHPETDIRHRLEHVQTLRDDQIERMVEIGVVASIFVNHVYYWGDRHRDRFLGQRRGERISPVASVVAAGLPFALHCDCPVTPVDPLFTMNTAVHRVTREGHVLGAEQRVSADVALSGYTSAAAQITGEAADKGRIAVGLLADFVVLDGDPLEQGPVDLSALKVLRTVVGGETVFEDA
ncbi:amidohydrolase [Rhodococcus sp. PAMC28707]|uniref:amidohydrolase n=1 Tax=unclassified Rhodococcus (in: high G+C Gram-positive bacteria) TaxID=192944 RepID=UPI00109DC355|nr:MULTISPECIES: amidohydrolase [unclassified Rhodococcus (in: high G+C Gram-positive bacteria)]QCB51298.1 amidohydrolase [Rhodococcus sp. PAMC28705]QCB60534.1 amidohydrolase [Rhodococcus sp. PAMC28707]